MDFCGKQAEEGVLHGVTGKSWDEWTLFTTWDKMPVVSDAVNMDTILQTYAL